MLPNRVGWMISFHFDLIRYHSLNVNHLKFILLCLAGWINREQQATIEYLQEEINVLLVCVANR